MWKKLRHGLTPVPEDCFIVAMVAAGRVWFCLGLTQPICVAETLPPAPLQPSPAAYRADRILVQPKPAVSLAALGNFHAAQKSEVLQTFEGLGRLQVLRVPEGETVPGLITRYERSGLVEFAEPDYAAHVFATPNDPKYADGTLWALNNTGQNGGIADADIDGPEAWDELSSASNIVVAVLDTGVRYTHEDLAANMWVNPNDGGPGLNAFTGTNDPRDDSGHGTLMAGVLGAVGNNRRGVVGVAWQVQIMACKCFDNFGRGDLSAILVCLDYARTNGARVINASWGTTNSLALSNALASVRAAGVMVVAACGNTGANVDVTPTYPACYPLDHIVSVAYTTRTDTLAADSNYGATNVDLAAPGEQIYSTFGATDTFYFTDSGTSFAAAYVSGALALMLARYPTETYQPIIARLLNATDPLPSLAGKCVTGGRLNLRNALRPPIRLSAVSVFGDGSIQLRLVSGPNETCVLEVTTDLMSWSPVFTNSTSASGIFDFTDHPSTNSAQRFYRGRTSP